MTIEELLQMRVGDVLDTDVDGVQVLRDVRSGDLRVILLARGEEAEYLMALVEQLSNPNSKESQPC